MSSTSIDRRLVFFALFAVACRGHVAAAPSVAFADARAQMVVDGPGTYRLSTTAKLRDGLPANPRVIVEAPDAPKLRTGNAMFDGLHALAIAEMHEASVASIRTEDFDEGRPVECPPPGCFETGRMWTYVWTRDTSYSAHLALGALDPARARTSLEFKLSERRGGGGLEIVQDTGSGGSWPVSTDRVTWALGAARVLEALDGPPRIAFRDRAFEALKNTIERDRLVVWDAADGLYRGEQSFLDWRAQTYPPWTATDTREVGLSKALSTNVVHLAAIRLAADLARERGDSALEGRWRGWADALRGSIRQRFWIEESGMFGTFLPTFFDPAPAHRFDLLGEALAVLFGVADERQAQAILRSYPHAPAGPPVVWPEEREVAVYHNRAVWPFVTAYWLLAARRAKNDAVADLSVQSLVRGAALNLSNMENFELTVGDTSLPVVDSQRQLWSVAGYLAMVHDVIFGREGDHFRPYVTRGMHRTLFPDAESITLDGLVVHGRRLTVAVHLPPLREGGGAYRVASETKNGDRIDVLLAADGADPPARATLADVHAMWAPRPPRITSVTAVDHGVRVAFDGDAEGTITNVYRDGTLVGRGARDVIDTGVDLTRTTPCYAAETVFKASGNASHHSRPVCFGAERSHDAKPDEAFRVAESGEYVVEILGKNPGDVTTGITCGVARLSVERAAVSETVARGYVFFPHGADASSYVRVHLDGGEQYRVHVDRDDVSVNMSAFEHFAHYTRGRGGRSGPENTFTIERVRLSQRAIDGM